MYKHLKYDEFNLAESLYSFTAGEINNTMIDTALQADHPFILPSKQKSSSNTSRSHVLVVLPEESYVGVLGNAVEEASYVVVHIQAAAE